MSILERHLKKIAQTDLKDVLERAYASIESAYAYTDKLVTYLKTTHPEAAGAVASARNFLYSALEYSTGMYSSAQTHVPVEANKVLEGLSKTTRMINEIRSQFQGFRSKTVNQKHLVILDKISKNLDSAEEHLVAAYHLLAG